MQRRDHSRSVAASTSGLRFWRRRRQATRNNGEALEFRACAAIDTAAQIRIARQVEPEVSMNGIIYLVGLIVVIMAILSFLGLR